MCRPPQSHVTEIRAKRYKTSGISRNHKRKKKEKLSFRILHSHKYKIYTQKIFLASILRYSLCLSTYFERTTLETPFLGQGRIGILLSPHSVFAGRQGDGEE